MVLRFQDSRFRVDGSALTPHQAAREAFASARRVRA